MDDTVMDDPNTGRPVRVIWIDSGLSPHEGWIRRDDVPKDVATVETVGLWMGENERVVMIGGTRDEQNENWLQVQIIYKPCITVQEWLA